MALAQFPILPSVVEDGKAQDETAIENTGTGRSTGTRPREIGAPCRCDLSDGPQHLEQSLCCNCSFRACSCPSCCLTMAERDISAYLDFCKSACWLAPK